MRPFFPPRGVALLRAINENDLTDRCTIWSIGNRERLLGGVYKTGRLDEATDVPCRLAPLNLRLPHERAIAAQYGQDVQWAVIFAAGRDVPNNRRLTVTGITNDIPWTVHLEVISQIIKADEMFRRVACKTLPEAKVLEGQ